MKLASLLACAFAAIQLGAATPVGAQPASDTPAYGERIKQAAAQQAITGAREQAAKEKPGPTQADDESRISVAVVDSGGRLVAFARMDNASLATIELALRKAMTAIEFQTDSKNVGNNIVELPGGLRFLKLESLPIDGGVLIVKDKTIIGAVGVAGGWSDAANGRIAKAAADAALK